eukprot:m.32215 g.32215  ORF g.32215 m.32215 type:complete len:211 (+) comp4972_c0_seq1:1846-2478(+)
MNLSHTKLSGHLTALPARDGGTGMDDAAVEDLNLQFNFIVSIDRHVFASFAALQSLYLGGNELRELPDLRAVPQLQCLKINNNKLCRLGDLSYLTRLIQLDVRANRIADVSEFACSHTLQRLSLASNLLVDIDAPHTPALPHLQFLGLFGNRFEHVDKIIAFTRRAPALQVLQCSGCPCLPTPNDVAQYTAAFTAAVPALQWLDWVPIHH